MLTRSASLPFDPPHRFARAASLVLLGALHVLLVAVLWLAHGTRDVDVRQVDGVLLLDASPRPAAAAPMREPRRKASPDRVVPTASPRRDAQEPTGSPKAPAPTNAPVDTAPSTTSDAPAPPGDAAPRPLDLTLHHAMPGAPTSPLTAASEALLDPRSNRLVLTPAEKRMVDFTAAAHGGGLAAGEQFTGFHGECVVWERQPDGTVFRGPGHYRQVPGAPARRDGSHVMECVK